MFVRRSRIDGLMNDMVKHRDKAVENSEYAKRISRAYVERFQTGGSRFSMKVDAERSAAEDARYKEAVEANQMYDRFAMRDAAVLSALLKMVDMGLIRIEEDRERENVKAI